MSIGIYVFGGLFCLGGLLYAKTTRNVANLRRREVLGNRATVDTKMDSMHSQGEA